MKKINVRIESVRPMLMNEFQPEEGTTKKGQVYEPNDECVKRLIKDSDDNICAKSSWIEGALVSSGAEFKFKGHKTYKTILQAGIYVDPDLIVLSNQDWEIDSRRVKIQRASIMRSRPIFREWSLDFDIVITSPDLIQPAILKEILENAGKVKGIGDYRPKYGLFKVTKFEEEDNGA